MYRLVILFIFSFYACSTPADMIKKINLEDESIYIDVVEKSLQTPSSLSIDKKKYFNKWFNTIFKTNGFSGSLIVEIKSVKEIVSKIENGEKFELIITLETIVEKKLLSKRKISEFTVNEYAKIEGSYSRNEYEILVSNTYDRSLNKLRNSIHTQIGN